MCFTRACSACKMPIVILYVTYILTAKRVVNKTLNPLQFLHQALMPSTTHLDVVAQNFLTPAIRILELRRAITPKFNKFHTMEWNTVQQSLIIQRYYA